jgi:hypothetical protein
MSTPHEEAGDLLQPMLDLFGGAEGGVAFARLRHSFLPDMLAQRGTNQNVDEFLASVERMNRLCRLMMGEKL